MFVHGMRNTKFYSHWRSMLNRCKYAYSGTYVERGIKVCKRWFVFLNFKEDMYASYIKHINNEKTTTLERINNDDNYSPLNCRWATKSEQNKNKSDTIIIGKNKNLKQIAKDSNIKYITLYARIKRYGYSLQKALSLPSINEIRKRKIYKMTQKGKIVKIYPSFVEAVKDSSVTKTALWRACNSKTHFSDGYYWRYV